MLGFLRSSPPVELPVRVWLERRFLWLVEKVGVEQVRAAKIVLPTPEFFPDPYDGSVDGARAYFQRICGYMNVDATNLKLEFYTDYEAPGVPGFYEANKRTVAISIQQLLDPMRLVATMTRALSHHLMHQQGLTSDGDAVLEPTIELFAVLRGAGVFAANSVVHQRASHDNVLEYWSISRHGHLTARDLGYSFALLAMLRSEPRPLWGKHLRGDAAAALKSGMRYLTRNENVLVDFENGVHRFPESPIEDRLAHRWDVVSLDAVHDAFSYVASHPDQIDDVVDRLVDRLYDDRHAIQAAAAATLGTLADALGDDAVVGLIDGLSSKDQNVRRSCLFALGKARPDVETRGTNGSILRSLFLGELREDGLVVAAAEALGQYRQEGEFAVPNLLETLQRLVDRREFDQADAVLVAIESISQQARCMIDSRLRLDDEAKRELHDTLDRL